MIVWQDLIGPVALAAFVLLVLIPLVAIRARRNTRELLEAEDRKLDRRETFRELQEFLLDKTTSDLSDADTNTTPYIKAFIVIIQMSGTVDQLRPIAEVYRHRSGFKNKWIGE